MHARLLHGPLLVLAYSVAPLPISLTPDSLSRYRLTVGVGGGQWENERFSCNGDLVNANKVPYNTGGAVFDAWSTPQVRLSVWGGNFHPTPDSAPPLVRDYNGPFFGGQLAFELHSFGIGGGFAHVSGLDGPNGPSAYLRLGSLDGIHARGDLFPPTATLGSTGWFRMGIGYGDGRARKVGGFVGIAIPPAYGRKGMFTAYLKVPVAQHLDIELDGIAGQGITYPQHGASIALRYAFGALRK